MKKYVFKKTVGKATDQVKREGATARKAVRGLVGIIPEIWNTLVGMIPKMIRLSVELIKSEKVSDRAKLILIGAICVTGFAVAEELINRITVFPLVFLLLGPFSAFISVAFFGTIKLLLLTVCFFVTAHVFNTGVENDEVKKLASTIFGEKDGKQFITDLQTIYQRLKKYLSPFTEKLMTAFEKIGKKKRSLNPDEVGDIVIRAAKQKGPILIGWSGSLQEDASTLISELDEKEDNQGSATDIAVSSP